MAASGERSRRRWRRLAVVIFAPLAGCLACEGILRWFLFSDSPLAERWGRSFRDAGLYVPVVNCDDYHKLRYLLLPGQRLAIATSAPHAELGWVAPAFAGEDLQHADEARIHGRRPVLLFGSSYAACSHPGPCFEELLEGSELGRDHCLLNYGVPAYGLDQTVLLVSKTTPRFVELDPVVVLALVVDVDLRRSMLSFYAAPKPRYVWEDEGLRLETPDEVDPLAHIERHPPGISSYLWRYLAYGVGFLPEFLDSRAEHERQQSKECRELTARCMGKFHSELEALGLEHFVLVFYSSRSFAPAGAPPRDAQPLLYFLRENGIPFIDSRWLIEEEARSSSHGLEELFLQDGTSKGHPSERGTQVLFRALQAGLERRYDGSR